MAQKGGEMSKLMIITKGKPIFKMGTETGKTFDAKFNVERDEDSGNDILSFAVKYRDDTGAIHKEDVVLDIQEDLLAFSVDGIPVFPIVEEAEEFVEINFNNSQKGE